MEGKVKEFKQDHHPENSDAFSRAALGSAETKGDTNVARSMNFDDNSSLLNAESSNDKNEFGIVSQIMLGVDNNLTSPGKSFIRQTKSLSAKFLVNMDELVNNVAGIFDDRSYIFNSTASHSLSYSLPLTCTNKPPEGRAVGHSPPSCEDDQESSAWIKMKPKPSLPICLKFQDINYKVAVKGGRDSVSEKCILHGVSGSVHPGEFLALMGPSGGGKTTLLNILSGRVKINSGTITYNDQPYTKSLKRRIGFVLQDDVVFPHLTVKETLIYAALLRLPNTLTTQQKKERAMYVITELGLDSCQDTVMGSTLVRGISGGERKRVCIGNEILLNPSLLFLDEPTSGLDSTTAVRIVHMLHHIAKAGTTVVTTIHQPSSRLFSKFDKLILLGKGNSLYFGKASEAMVYFASIGCSPLVAMNPAEFLIDLANGNINDKSVPPELEDKSLSERLETSNRKISPVVVHEYLVEAYEVRVAKPEKKNLLKTILKPKIQGRLYSMEEGATWWEQFLILFRRGLKERRHEYLNCTRVTQVISTAIIIGLLWWHSDASSPKRLQDQEGLLFFISVFWGFFPLFTAIFTFPQERAMLTKERSADMYKLSAYFLARNMSDIPLDLVLPTLFMLIVYFMVGLELNFTAFSLTVLTVFLSILAAQGFGLAIGAAFMDVKKASTLASVALMTFMLSGGLFIQKVPPFMSWVRYISFNHYTYRLLLKIQYRCGGSNPDRQLCESPFIRRLKLDSAGMEVGAMIAMVIGYRLLAYYFLKTLKCRKCRTT